MNKMTIDEMLNNFEKLFPNAHCELNHKNNYEMAVAVVLSAQTTDESVNRVTPNLFKKFPTVKDLANANIKDIENCIKSLGLYHNKAKSIKGMAQGIVNNFNGEIPQTINELITLPGIGRKCANVILAECYQIPSLAVDTHVSRISKRLCLVYQKDNPETIERKLKKKIPRDRWIKTHHQMIFFGRYLCHSRNPECKRCPFINICNEKNKSI